MPQILPPHVTATTVNPAVTVAVTPVDANVTSLPEKIQQLLRQIQVNGTVSAPPQNNSLILSTAVGEITLVLPAVVQAEQQKLLQLLDALFQSQKPITIVVQPGEPPTQAVILLPQSTGTNAAAAVTDTSNVGQALARALQSLAPGQSFPAVVLPPETLAALPGTQSNSATPLTPLTPLTALPVASALPATELPLTAGASLPANTAPSTPPTLGSIPATAPPLGIAEEENLLLQAVKQTAQNVAAEIPTSLPNLVDAAIEKAVAQLPATPQNISSPTITAPALETATTVEIESTISTTTAGATTTNPALANPTTAPAASTSMPLASLLQPGKEFTLTVNAVTQPGSPPPTPTAPNQIVATVIGSGPNGQPILKAGDAVLYIRQPVNAPVGSDVLITLDAIKPITLTAAEDPTFSSLQQVLNALAQADPAAARAFIQANIPQPNVQLPGVLMFLMSAFKQGDARGWLGSNAVDILTHAGKMELLAKLSGDVSNMGSLVRDPMVGEWKSYPIPLQADGHLQTLNFYVHGDHRQGRSDGKQDSNPGAGKVRFLIDMRTTRLGAIQLDGLVQPKKLDMIVRSEHTLPSGLPNDLRNSYVKTLGALGYTGGLSFQTGRQSWLVIQKDPQKLVIT